MKRPLPLLFLFVGIVFMAACKNGQPMSENSENSMLGGAEPADSLFLSFERTPCFGKCPAFRMKVYRSGYATYEGIQFAPRNGMHNGLITSEILKEILTEAELISFFELEKKYDGAVTDIPSMIIELKTNEKQHKVLARYGTPAELKTYGKYLDKIVEAVSWSSVKQAE